MQPIAMGFFALDTLVLEHKLLRGFVVGGLVLESGNRFESGLLCKNSRRNSTNFVNCFLQLAAASLSISRTRAFRFPILAILERNFGMRLWESRRYTPNIF